MKLIQLTEIVKDGAERKRQPMLINPEIIATVTTGPTRKENGPHHWRTGGREGHFHPIPQQQLHIRRRDAGTGRRKSFRIAKIKLDSDIYLL